MGMLKWNRPWFLFMVLFAFGVPTMSTGCGGDKKADRADDDDDDDDKKKKKKKKKKKRKKKKKKRSDDDDDEGEERANRDDDDGEKDAVVEPPPAVAPVPVAVPAPVPVANPQPGQADLLQGASLRRIPSSKLAIPIPQGWHPYKIGLYSGFASADDSAIVMFSPVSTRGELAGRVQDIERKLGITNEKKVSSKTMRLGPNKIRADVVDMKCNFDGDGGDLSYALVEQPGRRTFMLVVDATKGSAPQRLHDQAQAAILNIQLARYTGRSRRPF
ncbi:MAG: hypothetical protein AAGA56_07380 [Myxococcota bacterium]